MSRASSGGQATRGFTRRTLLRGAGGAAAGAAVVTTVPRAVGAAPPAQQAPVVRVGPAVVPAGTALIRLTVNGTTFEVPTDPRTTLAELLRDHLGLTATKVGCDRGECGSCTVLLGGNPVLSCATLALEAQGHEVTTAESLRSGVELSKLQQVFFETGAVQCGFCTPGMLMSATALLKATPKPTEQQAREAIAGNLCRCTGYTKIVDAIVRAGQV